MENNGTIELKVTKTDRACIAGEKYARASMEQGKVPVFSCEGGCIKGEIARQAASMVARTDGYARACHGELFTAPRTDLARWIKEAEKVVVIDGCSILCHGRIAENIIDEDHLVRFNAFAMHGKYGSLMDTDDVPEAERMETAGEVAEMILAALNETAPCCPDQVTSSECCG